jgi:flagellar biosynthesis protein FlhA
VVAGIVGLLGLIPGMPTLVFLVMPAACWAGARQAVRSARRPPKPQDLARGKSANSAMARPPGTTCSPWTLLGLEVGYRLITLVDKNRQGDLLGRIKGVRKKFAQDVGFLPPAVHIRDNLELKPSAYRITLRGAVVGEGEAFPGMFLAINPGGITTAAAGTRAPPTRHSACPRTGSTNASGSRANGGFYRG